MSSNLRLLDEYLEENPPADKAKGLLAELARSLAAEIDAAPEKGVAQTAKEYRATLKELTAGGDDTAAARAGRVLASLGDAS